MCPCFSFSSLSTSLFYPLSIFTLTLYFHFCFCITVCGAAIVKHVSFTLHVPVTPTTSSWLPLIFLLPLLSYNPATEDLANQIAFQAFNASLDKRRTTPYSLAAMEEFNMGTTWIETLIHPNTPNSPNNLCGLNKHHHPHNPDNHSGLYNPNKHNVPNNPSTPHHPNMVSLTTNSFQRRQARWHHCAHRYNVCMSVYLCRLFWTYECKQSTLIIQHP